MRNLVKIFVGDPRISTNPKFFGRIDLSRSLSRAKFDEEADFEVRSAVARQNSPQIDEKTNLPKKKFGVEKRNVRNRLKRVLAKFRANPSHVRRVPKIFFTDNIPPGINSTASYTSFWRRR